MFGTFSVERKDSLECFVLFSITNDTIQKLAYIVTLKIVLPKTM